MDGADVWRTSSWASRRPPDVISGVAILDPRWRRRKWRHPGPGAGFSTPIAAAAQDGGPSASGRHLGWPHLREPKMRSSKMATGSGRAAILRRRRNGGRKTRPILLEIIWGMYHSCQIFCIEEIKGIIEVTPGNQGISCFQSSSTAKPPTWGNRFSTFQKRNLKLFILLRLHMTHEREREERESFSLVSTGDHEIQWPATVISAAIE